MTVHIINYVSEELCWKFDLGMLHWQMTQFAIHVTEPHMVWGKQHWFCRQKTWVLSHVSGMISKRSLIKNHSVLNA
jgi:hypothetical protein